MEKVIGIFNTNRVRRNTGSVGVELQAVLATKVLGELVGSGLIPASVVAESIDRTTARFLNNKAFMAMIVPSGTDQAHDQAVESILTASGFLETVVSNWEPSRFYRVAARVKGLFR